MIEEPRVLVFVCNWCSYAGADQAGALKLHYPAGVRLVRVMCSGRVDAQMVLRAFRAGADGVLVLGCHSGSCHYRHGNLLATTRAQLLASMLRQHGLAADRLRIDSVGSNEGRRFQALVNEMWQHISKLGRLQLRSHMVSEASR